MNSARDMTPAFEHKYRRALQASLAQGGETPLHDAYELGREALASGMGLLDLVNTHHVSLLGIIGDNPLPHAGTARRIELAGRFLVECLSPYQMVQLGNHETNAALRRLNRILEEEARRIAHVLHDEAAQLLASVYLELAEILREAPPVAVQDRVERITQHLHQVRQQLRRLSHELRPPILDQLGLLPALEFLADGFRKRTGLEVTVEGPPGKARFPQDVETTLYRVVQEALNNVVRHAGAKRTDIRLWTEDRLLCCRIKDDGAGFTAIVGEAGAAHAGLGLLGMHERIATLNGRFDVNSSPGEGTELRISIPIRSTT